MRIRSLAVVLHASLVTLLLAAPGATQEGLLFEDDFERGELGAPPEGWSGPAIGPRGELVAEGAFQGERCARIDLSPDGSDFGNLIAVVPMDLDARSRLRLSAAVRVAGEGRAQLWLRFDYDDGESVLADNMSDRPIVAGDWQEHEIVADAQAKPGRAVIGLMVFDGARAELDGVRLERLGDAPVALEPPRPLSERGLANLVAFARLYGAVRWFHPSDEAAAADWEHFALEGVRRVEGARDAGELRAALHELFDPLAPTLLVHREADDPPPHPALRPPAEARGLRVRAWRHRGMGDPDAPNPIYWSRRLNERVRDGALPDGVADPAEPFRLSLGDGLAALVPLALYSNRAGTLPAGAAPGKERTDEPPALTGALQSEFQPEDRATRLAAVVIAWNRFQHFYPYFDVVAVDWPAELERALAAAAEDADARAFGHTLQRLVAALHDGHGGVYHASLMSSGRFPLTWERIDGELVVTWVAPQLEERLAAGDVVLALDGVPVEELLAEIEARTSAATPGYLRWSSLGQLARGSAWSRARLQVQVQRDADAPRELELEYLPPDESFREPRPEPIAELEPYIWYVDLDRATTEQFLEVLDELAAADAVVFDMRGYPSGFDAFQFFPHLIREAVESPQWHVPVLTRPDREGVEYERSNWTIEPAEPFLEAKRVFITDARAISYAESCMGIVEHYRLGEIVGEATAGTNGNVNPFTLPGGYQVTWTGMRVLKHDGSQHHGVGVLPTIPVARTRAGVAAGRDELLEAALAAARESGPR